MDRRKLRKLRLHHLSWIDILTEAVVQKEHRGIADPDQAYILGEPIWYLSDARSGAVAFDWMGPDWISVRDGARDMTLRKGDLSVARLASRWDDLVRYLALDLTADLGHQVRQVLPASERTPEGRRQALINYLTTKGRLFAEVHIPDAAGTMVLLADLRARQLIVSTTIDAPREGTAKGKVSWLLRQLQEAPRGLKVEAKQKGASATLAAMLSQVREDPDVLYPERGKEIRGYVLSLNAAMGLNRSRGARIVR